MYPFQKDLESLCVRSCLHRNVINLSCKLFLSRLLEAISLNVSWLIFPFRIFSPHGSPLQFSSSLGKICTFLEIWAYLIFTQLYFMEYSANCTLNYPLWMGDERKELLHLKEVRFCCLRIRTKCKNISCFTKSWLIWENNVGVPDSLKLNSGGWNLFDSLYFSHKS